MESVQLAENREENPSFMRKIWPWVHRQRWLLIFVGLPVFLSIIFYGLIASDVYVSETRYVIKSPSQKQAPSLNLANLIQTTGLSGGQEQTNEVLDYIRSRDALAALSKKIDVRGKFMNADADFLSRFPAPFKDDNFERLYEYYGDMVSAQLDSETGAAVLTVKSFSPKDSHDIAAGLLELSEAKVNALNARAKNRQVTEAEARVGEAEQRLKEARVALRGYRNSAQILDPTAEASGVLEVATGLTAQRAVLSAQLQSMLSATPRHPSIPALQRQLASIDAQIASQAGRAVGTSGGIATKMTEYENLLGEQEFALAMLTAAQGSLEQARTDVAKQQFYLERLVEPNTPDMALLPERLFSILTVIGVALCLYLVGWMLIVGILEHRPDE
jgi:capsular polysaccharide transport system permease protein